MKRHWRSWPQRFIRWLFGSPFRKLPAPFGPTVPADLQAFEDEAQEAQRHGVRSTIATPATRHAKRDPRGPIRRWNANRNTDAWLDY